MIRAIRFTLATVVIWLLIFAAFGVVVTFFELVSIGLGNVAGFPSPLPLYITGPFSLAALAAALFVARDLVLRRD